MIKRQHNTAPKKSRGRLGGPEGGGNVKNGETGNRRGHGRHTLDRTGEAEAMQPRRYITQLLALVLTLGAWTGLSPSAAAQYAGTPGVTYQEAEEVAPALAHQILEQRTATATSQGQLEGVSAQSFGTGGINAPANAEVIELARALRYDPDLIYEYVRDQIQFDPTYGAKRGAIGTLLDGYGNAFDQAQLMIELLRESGFTAGCVLGNIRFSPADVMALTSISSGTPRAAAIYFADGGMPTAVYTTDGTYNGTLVALDITHVWVKVNIGGTDYVFDPSLVPQDFTPSIDLATAMGYGQTTFLTNALSGATLTADYIKNVNRANIRSDLQSLATNLISYIKTNAPAATLEEIIGGHSPQQLTGQVRQTAHPNQLVVITDWAGDIPSTYHTLLRIEHLGIDHIFESREIYGKRLTIFYDGLNQPVLRLNGTTIATGTPGTPGQFRTRYSNGRSPLCRPQWHVPGCLGNPIQQGPGASIWSPTSGA
jgi:hypothetical protein